MPEAPMAGPHMVAKNGKGQPSAGVAGVQEFQESKTPPHRWLGNLVLPNRFKPRICIFLAARRLFSEFLNS